MCGIAGLFNVNLKEEEWVAHLNEMSDQLIHRGPDQFGIWFDPSKKIGLAHRRLSILDTSELGKQPMQSQNSRYKMVYNGEIYNFKDLKKELEGKGVTFKSQSDSEVLLTAFETWGLRESLLKIKGMYAIALWDRKVEELILIRDPIGMKPLYYFHFNNLFGFASEIKSFKSLPFINFTINETAVQEFLCHNYIPSTYSIYENIHKLEPGCFLRINNDLKKIETIPYWSLKNCSAQTDLLTGYSENELLEKTEDVLTSIIEEHMISDVSLGAFLSGGIDSSLVTSLMQKVSDKPIKTFSIGFEEEEYNEANYACDIANHLKTDHHEMIVSSKNGLNYLPSILGAFDEPFSDSSQLPTWILCRETRRNVKVALSGDGGDELFAGYQRYQLAEKLNNQADLIPNIIKPSLKFLNKKLSPVFNQSVRNKLYTANNTILENQQKNIYAFLVKHSKNPEFYLKNKTKYSLFLENHPVWNEEMNLSEMMTMFDMSSYLPNDILTKVDRCSMAHSLEARVPLLDSRFIEFCFSLPQTVRFQNEPKAFLKSLLNRYVPKVLYERPKKGFGIPLDNWLKNDLKEWGDDLLNSKSFKESQLWDQKAVNALWMDHQRGVVNNQYLLWNILVFQHWVNSQ